MNKYIILMIVYNAAVVVLAAVIMKKLDKRRKMSVPAKISVTLGLFISFMTASFLVYFSFGYEALPSAGKYLESGENVRVVKKDGHILFDGNGNDELLIFYPGAKVEYTAYSPLLYRIAEKGIDCCAVDMPFDFAIFGAEKAGEVMASYQYNSYILAGHSLGGVMAADFCAKNSEKVRGAIMLASYPSGKLAEDTDALIIYGSCDEVFEKGRLDESRKNLPADAEVMIIEGANHAGFGDYGEQSGDGRAEISPDEQKDIAAGMIYGYLKRNKAVSSPFL